MARSAAQFASLALVTIGVLVSCTHEGADPLEEGEPFTGAEIAKRFKDLTGDSLRLEGGVLDLTRLGFGRSISLSTHEKLWQRYGQFRFVVEIERGENLAFSVVSKPPGRTSEDGVYREHVFPERSADSPYWHAAAYRGNVRLDWFSDRKSADRRLRTLLAVLESLGTEH